jgi:hypothetical protein
VETSDYPFISLALAGKRDLNGQEKTVEAPLRQLFDAFQQTLPGAHIQLLTGLADGTDQIATKIFMETEGKQAAALDKRLPGTIIPYNRDAYLQSIKDQDTFNTLYNACSYRLQLDGLYVPGAEGKANRKAAYRQQANMLIRMCDVFIAVTSREEPMKEGGTLESIHTALSKNKPVIFLDTAGSMKEFQLYMNMEQWIYGNGLTLSPAKTAQKISDCFRHTKLSILPETRPGLFYKMRKFVAARFEKRFAEKRKAPSEAAMPFTNELWTKIDGERKELSRLAKYFQVQYRGGYLLNYLLAIIAITIAVVAAITYLYLLKYPAFKNAGYTILVVLGAVKVMLIVMMIINTRRTNNEHYNAKAIKFRYAAERLRVNAYFLLFGINRIPAPFVGNHSKEHLAMYEGESLYRQAISKIITGLRPDVLIEKVKLQQYAAFIKAHWLSGQISYYKRDEKKMEHMHETLERAASRFSLAVLVIIGIEIAGLLCFHVFHGWPEGKKYFDIISPVLLGLTILFPAIVTTLNSLHFQTEAKRLAFRHGLMIKALEKIETALEMEIGRIDRQYHGSHLQHVLNILDEAAGLMTDEVAEWTMIYEKQVYEPG